MYDRSPRASIVAVLALALLCAYARDDIPLVGTSDWNARAILLERWRRVYVAYVPLDRDCAGEPGALGPFTVLELVADPRLPREHIRLELFDFSAHLLRTDEVMVHHRQLRAAAEAREGPRR